MRPERPWRPSTSGCATHGVFGGKDLSQEFPALGQSALYCVTEIHTSGDLDRLAAAIGEIVRS